MLKTEIFGYPVINNIVLFQKGFLSNWYGAFKGQENGQFEISTERDKKMQFNCSEQAMMYFKAIKFDDYETADKILAEKSPREQKALGRLVKNYDDRVWNQFRFKIVTDIVTEKFFHNKQIRDFLCIDLANYILAEAADYDKIWGIGLSANDPRAWDVKTWQGKNLLGKALMMARTELSRIFYE